MSPESPNGLLKNAKAEAERIHGNGKTVSKTIAMFDLSGSTPLKLSFGHTLGTRAALQQNIVCRRIAKNYGGAVVKELGDGVLIVFDDPLKACNAAIDIKKVTPRIKNCLTKAGLTIGLVEEVEIGGIPDVLGSTIDRCARIQSMAAPGQILIDKAFLVSVESFLKDNKVISISEPNIADLKGIGQTELYELSLKKLGFVGWQQPFSLHVGRLPVQEKIRFMKEAKTEIIEVGIGLRTLSSYFTGRSSSEFRDYLFRLLQNGVTIKCYLLDPKSSNAQVYARDRGEENLIANIQNSISLLQHQAEEFAKSHLKGSLEVYVYDRLPYFYIMCIDPASNNARMAVSHYMPGVLRADTPVIQFSKISNSDLYEKYWLSLQDLTNSAKFVALISMEQA